MLDVSKVKLRDPESILRELKVSRMFVEVQHQAVYEFGMSFALETKTLFSGLGTDVHFSGDGSVMQWRTFSSCRKLIGLVTSRIVTVTLVDGACEVSQREINGVRCAIALLLSGARTVQQFRVSWIEA